MKRKKDLDSKAEKIQEELEEAVLKPEKYESRYKHGGPGRTVKKKAD
jgi:hypothetical protein